MLFKRQKVDSNREREHISFIIMHDDFAEYNWITVLPDGLHTISIFETAENSFSKDVMAVFIEILKKLANSCFSVYKIEKSPQIHTEKGTLSRFAQDEKHLYKISRGIDAALLWLQTDTAGCWDETEIYCCTTPLTHAILCETIEQYMKSEKFSFYFLVDAIRCNLTIKFPDKNDSYEIEQRVRNICQKMQVSVLEWNS